MRTYYFWIRRAYGSGFERIAVEARDSRDALNMLPACVSWGFAKPYVNCPAL